MNSKLFEEVKYLQS